MDPALRFLLAWLLILGAHAAFDRHAFRRHPDKGRRYRRLPLRYKLACRLLVMPLCAGIVVHPAMALPAGFAWLMLEGACMRWYRRAGLLS